MPATESGRPVPGLRGSHGVLRVLALAGLWLAVFCAAPIAVAQTRIADLQRYHTAMQAMQDLDEIPAQQRYRAGLFDGLVDGVLEGLAMRGEACLPGCRCDVREAVTRRLASDAPPADALALPWLHQVLKESFPCPQSPVISQPNQ